MKDILSGCSGFHYEQMDELLHHDEGNLSRSLALSELSGARLPRLLFESVMNGARKCVSVLGTNLRWPVFQSSIRPKLSPALTATPCFYPGSGCTPDQAVSRERFQKKAIHFFYQPSCLSGLCLLPCLPVFCGELTIR